MSYWICLFFCYYSATILGLFVAFASEGGMAVFVLIVLCGICIDVVRRFKAPELQLSPSERNSHIQRALKDENYMRYCNKYRLNSNSVSWLWGGYLLLTICIPALREPSILTNNSITRTLVGAGSALCPFLDNRSGLAAAFVTSNHIFMAVNFLSLSWWFMLAAAILEISGGAFYAAPKWVVSMTKPRDNKSPQPWTNARLTRSFFIYLTLTVICYFVVGIVEFTKAGTVRSGIHKGDPISLYGLMQILYMSGGAVVLTAVWIRFFYSILLYKISKVLWNDHH